MSGALELRRASSLEEVRPAWTRLAESAGGVFCTWEWADAWWRHHGRGELLVHEAWTPGGEPAAILPLYRPRAGRPRVVRFLGHGPADELGPVHAPGGEDVARTALLAALKGLDWDVFLGEQLPGGRGWPAALHGRRLRHERSPALVVPDGGWSAYLEQRSANLRQQLASRRRRLEQEGRLSFRLATADSLERDLDTLFALHRARWRGRRTDFAETPFHRELARTALARGWLRLWLLELDGAPLAAWHGFHAGGVTSYYQAGRDPEAERLSAGFVLLAHSLRAAMDEGALEYRFGRGGEPFKYRFADRDEGLETVAVARGPLGLLAVGSASAGLRAWRARRLLRRPQAPQ